MWAESFRFVQVEFPLSKMLGTRSVLNFIYFSNFGIVHILNEILDLRPKFKCRISTIAWRQFCTISLVSLCFYYSPSHEVRYGIFYMAFCWPSKVSFFRAFWILDFSIRNAQFIIEMGVGLREALVRLISSLALDVLRAESEFSFYRAAVLSVEWTKYFFILSGPALVFWAVDDFSLIFSLTASFLGHQGVIFAFSPALAF